MVKNKLILMTVAGVFLCSAFFVQAQNTRLDQLRENAEERAEQLRERIAQLREQSQLRAEEAREKAQERMAQLRDEKKREAAQRIAGQFDHINGVWTDHFVNVLDRLDAVLQKIKSRS